MRFVVYIFLAFVLSACSSLQLKTSAPNSYNNGVAIFHDTKQNSKIQFEIAQEKLGGLSISPLLIYIMVENLNEKTIDFDIANINAKMNEKPIKPLTYKEVKNADLSLIESLSEYGIEVKTPPLRDLDSIAFSPFFSPGVYYPFFPFYPYGGFGFFDYSFARSSAYANAVATAREREAKRVFIMQYLRRNTIAKNEAKGGFVLFPYHVLESGDFILQVKVGDDEYILRLKLES